MKSVEELAREIMKEYETEGEEPVTMEEAMEIAEEEMKAKQNRHYEQSTKEKKKTAKERKIDTEKAKILHILIDAVSQNLIEVTNVNNEADFNFTLNGNNYTVKLVKHRAPKKK